MLDEIREAAEADLETFIKLVAPGRFLGSVHKELIRWWTKGDAKDHQLTLLPRDHMKSALIAYRVAWELTRDPTLRVLYISATSGLAEKQLGFIKTLFESKVHQRYWPLHIKTEEGRRSRWTTKEIELDHPRRKEEQIRDPSIMVAGLTTNIAGLHFDIAVLDDVVVYDNAYTQEGRKRVETQYSFLASIEGTGSREWVVGTRYHPKDLYNTMKEMLEPSFDEGGQVSGEEPIYEIFERVVEDAGDGTGEFLWPRQQRPDGKWFGFDIRELARKKAKYLDRTQFRAQYYNNPTDPESRPVDYDKFQYFERRQLTQDGGNWHYNGRRLNLIASIDFAYSTRVRADYTALVVVGVDYDNNIYVLDIDRFKTSDISEYFKHILASVNKWGFRKLRAETSVAQKAIVSSLKYDYIATHGLALSVDEVKPNRHQGSKEERMEAILVPRYSNLQVFHYKGGNCQLLEEELVTNNPTHDDIKDALATAIEGLVKPMKSYTKRQSDNVVHFNSRFGGRV
jgi:hypothetical protein